MQKVTTSSLLRIKRYKSKGHIVNSKKNSIISSYFGIATIIALIAGDQVRVSLPGQPIYISLAPLLLTIIGVFLAYTPDTLKKIPKSLKIATSGIIVLCVYGSLFGLVNDLVYKQIIAGWISYAGPVPGLLLGYTIGKSDFASTRFARWNYFALVFVLIIALMQQFGLFEVEQIVLEGSPLIRGVQGLGNFKYTTGPFRTASVFSIFLACSTVIFLFGNVRNGKKIRNFHTSIIAILVIFASLLAARRSGLLMLMGVLLPFFYLSFSRIWFRTVIFLVPFLIIGGPFFNEDSSTVTQELEAKFAHSITNTGFTDRARQVFDVRDSDWSLLTLSGDGLGSYGAAVQAAGPVAAAKAEIRLNMHPIIHYGWFKDIATLGPVGLIIHLLFFYWLGVLVNPYMVVKRKTNHPVRWSGFGLCTTTAIVYFFIATSWLQGITGGVMFGLAMGFVSGRLSYISFKSHRKQKRIHNQGSSSTTVLT